MVTKAKKALLASLAAFLCVMLTVFGLSMSVSLSEKAKAADETTTEVAEVNGVKFATLAEAVNAVSDGGEIVVYSGVYTIPNVTYTGKSFTISAGVDQTVSFDMSVAHAIHGAKVSFNNVTFDYKTNNNYIGLQHADTLTYKGCTINGMVFLYAINETFNGCTFNQTSKDAYNVWTYGAKNVAFNHCVFNSAGKSVLVYNEGANPKTDLTVSETKFVASEKVDGKAAIEIDTSLMADGTTITIDDKTTATNFAAGSNSGNTLWNDKKQTADTNKNTTITVADKVVYAPYVVAIGEVKYFSLTAAIAAAKDGETVKLLADVEQNSKATINKNITLDLNGKKIYNTKDIWSDKAVSLIDIRDGAKVTVMGDGTIAAKENDCYTINIKDGGLTIENGTFVGNISVVQVENGELTINGGTFSLLQKWDGEDRYLINCIDKAFTDNTAKVAIYGGSFVGFDPNVSPEKKVDGKVSSFAAPGVGITKNEDGSFTAKANMAAQILDSDGNSVAAYATLEEAVNAAVAGQTVMLLTSVDGNFVIEAGKDFTLDLNGYTINGGTGTAKAAITNYGTLTIKDSSAEKTGKIKRDDNGVEGETSYYVIQNLGTMTIEQANVVNNSGYRKTNPSGSMVGSSLICNGDNDEGATLTIKGGKLTQTNFLAIKNGANGELHVEGGTITSNHSAVQNWFNATITGGKITGQIWTDAYIAGESVGNTVLDGDVQFTGEIVMDVYGSIKPELTINGGNLSVTNWKVTAACAKLGGKPAVSGGTFTNAVPAEYCADRFIPTQNADGTYGVKACVAKVGSTKYETLAEAIAAAKDGETVTLLDNITLTEQLVIGKNLTIDLGGFTLTSNYSLGASGANIYAIVLKAAVTIKNGKIVADNARVIGAYGAMIMDGVTVENGIIGGHATIGLSKAGSEYVIRNSTINGAYSVSIFANNATVTITDCKLIGRGNTLYHNGSNYGLKLTVTGTEISSSASCGVYISGSTEAQSNTANQNGAGGYQQATFTRCTISGTNGIEVKYTNLTLNSCNVSTTENTPLYKQDNNGPAASGFAVVSTDNAMGGTTPAPKGTIAVSGEGNYVGAIGIGTLIKNTYEGFEDASYAVSGGKFNHAILPEYCADGFIPQDNGDGTFGVKEGTYVAEVKGVKYETLQAAFDAAPKKATVKLLADTRENVVVDKVYELTFDLNGFTLNGGTEKGKPALTLNNRRLIIKDSSAAQTGTIMREDTAENSGVSSHYVIDIQGDNAFLKFESGNVKNNSGVVGVKGASLVRVGNDSYKSAKPTLTIAGGTFTQDNFIVIKVDHGAFYLTGGELNSKNSYAIENWLNATVRGGTVNGTVSSWTYSDGSNSTLTISGGTINGDVTSVNYGNATDRTAKVSVTGGTVNGELDTRSYDPATGKLTSINDAAKATIEVTGGTFKEDPSKYVVEESVITKNADRTFGVEKAYLAKVGDTSYYTMDEAFKAQTKSGETIVLLRDYTTGSTFNSGSIHRVVDLNGHTWTCTSTDTNSAAFEINYADVTLTVKNGKIISNTLVGLIPSAMGGTIKYDNAGLVFEGVEMTSNGSSGIETNGNNTNDSVTLKDSTLNVPNGFGIYFPSSGTLTIDNSTIEAKTMGVQVCSGKLNINAGSAITVTGDAVPKAENDGAIQDGAAISIVNRPGYKGLSNIVITGGTFTAKAGNDAIKAYDWANKVESDFTKADLVAVSGGTFSSEVKKDYLADRFVVNKNTNGTYGVTAGSGFAGANVVVTESLAMKVTIANGTASKYVVVTYKGLDGIDKSVKLDTLTDGYYLFDRIMPQMIDVKFSFELYGENDVMLDRKANYSVVDYLANIIAGEKDSAAFRNVAASLIEYANRAKTVKGLATIAPEFVKGTEKVDLTELYKTFIADEKNKIPAKDTLGEISEGNAQVIYKARVVFDDAYTLKFYANAGEGSYTYTLSKNGSTDKEEEITFDKNGEFAINVLAQDITTQYVIKVYGGDKTKPVQTVTYGVSTYCIRMQETKTPQGELYVASYYYGVAVQQYGAANLASVK